MIKQQLNVLLCFNASKYKYVMNLFTMNELSFYDAHEGQHGIVKVLFHPHEAYVHHNPQIDKGTGLGRGTWN